MNFLFSDEPTTKNSFVIPNFPFDGRHVVATHKTTLPFSELATF
jgi:hypothetical protein